jgi:hypothetical protein
LQISKDIHIMAQTKLKKLASAAGFVLGGVGLTLGGQDIAKVVNPTHESADMMGYITKSSPTIATAFVGSAVVLHERDQNRLSAQQEEKYRQDILARNDAIFASQIEPLLNTLKVLPADKDGNEFVVHKLLTHPDSNKVSYEVDHARVFEIEGKYNVRFPKVTLISVDNDTNIHTYKEDGHKPFVITVGDNNFSIEDKDTFRFGGNKITEYSTIESLYKGIGEHLRNQAPSRLDAFTSLERGVTIQQVVANASGPTPAI